MTEEKLEIGGHPLLAVDANGDYQYVRLDKDGKVIICDADRDRIDRLIKALRSVKDHELQEDDRKLISKLLVFLHPLDICSAQRSLIDRRFVDLLEGMFHYVEKLVLAEAVDDAAAKAGQLFPPTHVLAAWEPSVREILSPERREAFNRRRKPQINLVWEPPYHPLYPRD